MHRAAFLDRDGVINLDHGYVHKPEEFEWVPGVLDAARVLHDAGFMLIVVTNQSGIGRGYYDEAAFIALTDWMKNAFAKVGAPLSGVYFCPHHPEKALGAYRQVCNCRKPAPGMLIQAAEELSIDLAASVMFGDKPDDCRAGAAAGCAERVLLGSNGIASPETIPNEATHAFRSLADAVASPWFREFSEKNR